MSRLATAIITGANGGIGQALCAAFHDAGYRVIATARGPDADCVCAEYISFDLTDVANSMQSARTFRDLALGSESGVDVLVNNAAIQILASTDTLTLEEFRTTLEINLVAPLALTKALLADLEARCGAVINIGSIHARLTKPRFVAYATSKAALQGLTRSLAVDLGGRVRVNAIEPAAVDTGMLRDGFKDSPDAFRGLQDCHPAGRIADPAEVARAALYLADPGNASVTGSILEIGGGIGGRLHDPE